VKLTVHVDGGSRGNPGPAAIAAVLSDRDGEIIYSAGEVIGRATNNVAEYRALIFGIEQAANLGATELDLVGDSELIVKQIRGEYKVKDQNMKPLHAAVHAELTNFDAWSIRHVKREYNAEADRLVNEALDARG
jgi:ribonuclease HI